MNAPLYMYGAFGYGVSLAIAVIIGFFFGFVLERAGFGNARNLTSIFYFRDFRVLRVMFTAIITCMVGLYVLKVAGLLEFSAILDYSLLKTYLWPQLVGGLLFGIGFVMGGYCPGTSVVGVGSGKLDALVFLLGMVAGVWVFAAGFPYWGAFYKSSAMGRITLWQITGTSMGVMTAIVFVAALGAFYVASLAEKWAPYGK